MANQKISALTALTGANTDALADVMPIVDTSAGQTKKILVSELAQAMLVLGTEQASTAGTSIDFTGIPAWAKKITIQYAGVSTNGTSNIMVQLGDSGGIETSGYLGSAIFLGDTQAVAGINLTTGIGVTANISAITVMHGTTTLTLEDAANFTWVGTSLVGISSAAQINLGGGSKSTSAALDRVRITTVGGADTFDAGAINILFE